MAEVLIEFVNQFESREGTVYEARACGRQRDDGLWEGWVEFVPKSGSGSALRTGRETTQPNEADLRYWASGLTAPYLEGALARAEGAGEPAPRREYITSTPAFEEPSPVRQRGSPPGAKRGPAPGTKRGTPPGGKRSGK